LCVKLIVRARHDRLVDREIHCLEDRRKHEVLRRLIRVKEVCIGTNEGYVTVGFLDCLQRRLVDRATNWKQHVYALVENVCCNGLCFLVCFEATSERTGCTVPAHNRHVSALNLVVVVHALQEAIHEDGHCWEFHTTEGTDFAGLRVSSGEVSSEESRLSCVI